MTKFIGNISIPSAAVNGPNELIQATSDGKLPALDGSNLTNTAGGSFETNAIPDNIASKFLAYWSLDSDGIIQDSIGGVAVTPSGSDTATDKIKLANKLVEARAFSGSTFLTGPTSGVVSPTGSFSFIVGVVISQLPTGPSDFYAIVSKDTTVSGQRSYVIYISPDNKLTFQAHPDGTTAVPVESSVNIQLNTPYFIHAYFDSATSQIGISVNGETPVTTSSTVFTSSSPFRIGTFSNTASFYNFRGSIAFVGLSNLLTPSECNNIRNAGNWKPLAPSAAVQISPLSSSVYQVLDTFQGADNTLITDRDPDIGPRWTTTATTANDTPRILNGVGVIGVSGARRHLQRPIILPDNWRISATISRTGGNFGIIFALHSDTTPIYSIDMRSGSYVYESQTQTFLTGVLPSSSVTGSLTDWNTLGFEKLNNVLRFLVNGVIVKTITIDPLVILNIATLDFVEAGGRITRYEESSISQLPSVELPSNLEGGFSAGTITVIPGPSSATISQDTLPSGSSWPVYTRQLYRSTVDNFTPDEGTIVSSAATLPFLDVGLLLNNTYFYRVVVTDGVGIKAATPQVSTTIIEASLRPATKNPLTFTVTGEPGAFYMGGNGINGINDGSVATGTVKTSGGTAQQLVVLVTFPTEVYLNEIVVTTGQFNGSYNKPDRIAVYRGNSTSGPILLPTSTPLISGPDNPGPGPTTTIDLLGNSNFDTASTQYLFAFIRDQANDNVSVLELILRG